MMLIVILFCLALQRFANIGGWSHMPWFELYLKNLHPWISKLNEWVAILLIVAPVALLLASLHLLFMWWPSGLFNLILATTVLFFCIDSRDFKNKLTNYFSNLERGDTQASASAVADIIGDVSSNTTAELNRAVTKAILLGSFEQLFAGLFWFIIAGIYGLSTYFVIALLSKNAAKFDSSYTELARIATKIRDVFDWIPSRLVGLSYSLVGNFNKGFGYCHKNLWSGFTEVKKFAVDAGLATLNLDTSAVKATPKENYDALDLINRALIVWLVALSLVLLGILI